MAPWMTIGLKMQNVTFSKFHPKNHVHFHEFRKYRNEIFLYLTLFQPFNICLKPICYDTDMVSSGPNTNHLKLMQFFLHFPTNLCPWQSLVSDLHKKLLPHAFSMTTEKFAEFEEKCAKISSVKG